VYGYRAGGLHLPGRLRCNLPVSIKASFRHNLGQRSLEENVVAEGAQHAVGLLLLLAFLLLLATFRSVVIPLTAIVLNLLSVGAIDFGLIVDASVLMVENIFRHLGEGDNPDIYAPSGLARLAGFGGEAWSCDPLFRLAGVWFGWPLFAGCVLSSGN